MGKGVLRALEMASAAVRRYRPDMIIAGGDLINGGLGCTAGEIRAQWELYSDFQNSLGARVYAAIGNRDLAGAWLREGPAESDPRREFKRRMGLSRTWYIMDAGAYRFLFLDPIRITSDPLHYRGEVPAEQLRWLREQANSIKPNQRAVLVTHMPILTAFYQATCGGTASAPLNRIVANGKEVLDILQKGNKLVLVLQGHLHVNEMIRWRGTTFITGGAVCGRWWRGAWHGTPPGFGVVSLDGDRVDWEYVGYN